MDSCLLYHNKDYNDPKINPQNKGFCDKKEFPNLNSKDFKHSDFMEFIQDKYDSFDVENPFKFSRDYIKLTSDQLCNISEMSLNPQQKFAGQLVNPNTNINNVLIYHGLGSGKTCTGLVIGQSFANRNHKNIMLVVPAALERQYYDEIIGTIKNDELWSCTSQCVMMDSDGELTRRFYSNVEEQKVISQLKNNTEKLEKSLRSTPSTDIEGISKLTNRIKTNKQLLNQKQNKVAGEVSKVFTITTHDKFINSLLKIEDNKIVALGSRLERGSSLLKDDTVLIIDEIQNLVSEVGVKYKILYLTMKYFANLKLRKVFLTATPIYDNPYEYALTINLFNPRVPFPSTKALFNELFIGKIVEDGDTVRCLMREPKENIDYKNACLINKDLFRYMTSGYVSYFKGGNPNAYPYKRVIEMFHAMKHENKDSYIEAIRKDLINEVKRLARKLKKSMKVKGKIDDKIEGLLFDPYNQSEASGILPISRQAINVSMSKENINAASTNAFNSFEESIDVDFDESTRNRLNRDTLESSLDNEKFTEISNMVNTTDIKINLQSKLKNLSNVEVLNKLEAISPKMKKIIEISESENRTVFVYSNWVGAGVESFAVFLDSIGYVRFPAKGPKRYFIWSPSVENDATVINNARNTFNNTANKDGSMLKYMIGTSSIKEGVSFKNVGQVHIIDPWWNNSRIEQITARAIRLCSHVDLPVEERTVDVYRHYSVYESYFDGSADPDAESVMDSLDAELGDDQLTMIALGIVRKVYSWVKYLTIDQRILEIANRKDDINNKFLKAIKSASVDCQLLKDGNIIRLEECIKQVSSSSSDIYQLYYKNPSTLDIFLRKGVANILDWNDIKIRKYSYPNSLDFDREFVEAEYNEDLERLTEVNDQDAIDIIPDNKYLNILEDIECWNNNKKLKDLKIDGDRTYILNKTDIQSSLPDIRKFFLLEREDNINGGIMFSTDDRLKKERILNCLSEILSDKKIPIQTKNKLKKILKKIELPLNPVDKIKFIVDSLNEPLSQVDVYMEIYKDNPKMIEDIFNEIVN